MDRHNLNDDDLDAPPDLPQNILADIAAGLDDLKHSRGVEGHVVLARLDAMIAAAKRRRAISDQDGENSSDSSAPA